MNNNSVYPTQRQIHRPLLLELHARGGMEKPKNLYDTLATYFNLTEEMKRLKQNDGRNKWKNDVQYARLQLVQKGLIKKPSKEERGTWKLTDLAHTKIPDLNNESVIENELTIDKMTQEALEEILEIQKAIGDFGEEIVKNYEVEKLNKLGMSDLCEKVKIISGSDCRAGFDIISFDEQGNEKYIEVKSSTTDESDFYISLNEINKSKELKNGYCLYLVRGIDLSKKTYKKIIELNDVSTLLDSNLIELLPIKWRGSLSHLHTSK